MEILNQSQKKQLLDHFTKIQKLYEKKKKLRKKMGELNGKILITKQIIEEAKRRNDENHLYYRDQILELNDNVSKKTSLVKQFQKKFNEVEIFIQRESQNEMNIDQWGHWKTFTIVPFLLKNENLLKLKSYYDILIEKRVLKATDLIEENKNIRMKKTINYTFSNEKRITNIQTLLASVENKTMFFERLKEQFQILIEKITKSENTPKKEVIPAFAKLNHFTEELETLPLNIDDNKQMTQGMIDMNEEEDQIKNKPVTMSKINNFKEVDKGEHLQNDNNEPIPNDNNNDNWDISRIEKKE